MRTYRVLSAACLVLSGLAACSGSTSTPAAPAIVGATAYPTAAPPTVGTSSMNMLTSYTVYAGSVDGSSVVTELSSLATAPNPGSTTVAAAPVDMLTTGAPLAPTAVPGAVVSFPDGSTVVADALGNFDASQAPWTIANQASISAGTQVEVVVDPSDAVPVAAPGNAYVDVDEPSGQTLLASDARSTLASTSPSPSPSPTPVVLAKLQVQPASEGMYDKEQRTFHAVGFDKNGKKLALGGQNVTWSVGNCSGAAAAGKLQTTREKSKIVYRAPATGSAATCPDIVTASYQSPGVTAPVTATAKAYYYAHETSVLYSGNVLDTNGKPVAKAVVDFFATTATASTGRILAITDKNGAFSRKIPAGRTPAFLVANRVASGKSFKYQWYNVTVTPSTGTTSLVLRETTTAARANAGP